MQDEFHEHIQKRLRNLQKRKQRLDRYAEQVTEDINQLNSDQLAALKHKDSVEAPLRELSDVLTLYEAQTTARLDRETEIIAEAEQRGREAGIAATKDQLRIVTKFLHLAALRHQTPDGNKKQLEAVDNLLQQLYLGTDAAVTAAQKLAEGSDEKVVEKYSYAQLKQWSLKESPEKAANFDSKTEKVNETEVKSKSQPTPKTTTTTTTVSKDETHLDATAGSEAIPVDSEEHSTEQPTEKPIKEPIKESIKEPVGKEGEVRSAPNGDKAPNSNRGETKKSRSKSRTPEHSPVSSEATEEDGFIPAKKGRKSSDRRKDVPGQNGGADAHANRPGSGTAPKQGNKSNNHRRRRTNQSEL